MYPMHKASILRGNSYIVTIVKPIERLKHRMRVPKKDSHF